MMPRRDNYAAYLARYWTVAYLRALVIACGAKRRILTSAEWRARWRQ
jgi:hypothetical protein